MTVRLMSGATAVTARSMMLRVLVAPLLAAALATTWFAAPGHATDAAPAAIPGALPGQERAGLPAAAKDGKLTINVTQVAVDTVAITGSLMTSDGRPLRSAVAVFIDGRVAGSVTTGADGGYSARVPGLSGGKHTATVAYAGSSAVGATTASQSFTMSARAPASPANPAESGRPPASAGASSSASVLTATVSPAAIAGGYVDVSGTLTSAANAPIDSGRIEVETSWGGAAGAAATDAGGSFSVSVGLPNVPVGQTPPASMTVTVTYPGDGRYAAATATFQVALKAPGPPPPPPTIRAETPAPPAEKGGAASAPPAVSAGVTSLDVGGAAKRGVALLAFVLAVGAVTAFAGMGAVAWRSNQLMPGERRGFGTDFGK